MLRNSEFSLKTSLRPSERTVYIHIVVNRQTLMKTYRLAKVFDPQCWFAHEGSLDPLEGKPSPLWQWRCLLVLRLERNPYREEQKLNYWSKIHL